MKKIFYALLTLQAVLLSAPNLFAQDDESAPPPDQGFTQTLIMIAIALVFFYVILWRPEQKRRKAMEDQRSALKQGDRVTAVGIIGTVVRIQDQTIILKMYDGSKIEVLKAAVNEILPSETNGKDSDEPKLREIK